MQNEKKKKCNQTKQNHKDHLDNDIPSFEAGAIINTDVAAESLPQINSPKNSTTQAQISSQESNFHHQISNTKQRTEKREETKPEGLGEDEEAGEREGVGRVFEQEAVAEAEIGGGGGGGGGEEAGGCDEVLAGEEVGGVEAEDGVVGLEGGAAESHHAEGEGVVG